VFGNDLKQFFRNAVIGMFQSVGPQAPGCRVEGEQLSSALKNFLIRCYQERE